MKKDRSYIHNRIYYFLFLILSFTIPLYDRAVALTVSLLALNWIIEGRFRQKLRLVKSQSSRFYTLLFAVLFLVYLTGLLYSENLEYGLFDLQIKFSLFLFPLFLATIDLKTIKVRINHFLIAFTAGCFLITIILPVHSFFNFLETKSISEFFYGKLAWYIHASYIAMFLVFAIGLITYYLQTKYEKTSSLKKIILIFLLTYFFIFIIMLSSKAGIISLVLVLLFHIDLLLPFLLLFHILNQQSLVFAPFLANFPIISNHILLILYPISLCFFYALLLFYTSLMIYFFPFFPPYILRG